MMKNAVRAARMTRMAIGMGVAGVVVVALVAGGLYIYTKGGRISNEEARTKVVLDLAPYPRLTQTDNANTAFIGNWYRVKTMNSGERGEELACAVDCDSLTNPDGSRWNIKAVVESVYADGSMENTFLFHENKQVWTIRRPASRIGGQFPFSVKIVSPFGKNGPPLYTGMSLSRIQQNG